MIRFLRTIFEFIGLGVPGIGFATFSIASARLSHLVPGTMLSTKMHVDGPINTFNIIIYGCEIQILG